MSYVSLLKNVPDILSQPAGIAAIASVVIHGGIAMFLPLMPVDSQKSTKASSPKSVGLVELSKADQNRLPQIPGTPQAGLQAALPLQPQVPLPNFANPPKSLPPLPLAGSSTQLMLPPIPKTPNNYPIASAPKGQSLGLIPQKRNFQIDTSGFNANTKAAQSFPRFDNNDVKIGRSSQPLPVNRLPELQANNRIPDTLPNTPASPNPSDTLPPTPIAEGSNTPPSMPVGDDVSKIPTNQQLIAAVGDTPKPGDNLSLAAASLPQWQQRSTPEIPLPSASDLQKPDTTTAANQGLIAKTTTFAEQFVKVKEQYPNIETKQPISLAIDKAGLERRVEVGLVVNPDGKKVESVEFLDNSVSSESKIAIREYLREYFQKNPADANGKPKYYTFSVSPSSSGNSSDTPRTLLPRQQVNQQPLPAAQQPAVKPFSGLRIISKPPLPAPQSTVKPLSSEAIKKNPLPILQPNQQQLLEVQSGNQSLSVPQFNKPQSQVQAMGNQPLPKPQANQQQLLEAGALRGNQPSPKPQVKQPQLIGALRGNEPLPKPQAKQPQLIGALRGNEPLPKPQATNQQQLIGALRGNEPSPKPEATPKPSSAPEISSNQPLPSAKPSQKLLQQLRELKEQRETNSEK